MKKWMFVLLSCISAVFLIACGAQSNNETPTATASDKVVVGYSQFPANIDPAADYNGWFTIRYGVGETLFKLNENLEVEPWLAESIEQISETEWKIVLKESITFQNGQAVTAEKVKASLERLIAESERAAADLTIESISTQDSTLIIKTKQPLPVLANILAEPYSAIIDVEAMTNENKVVGTGPYSLVNFVAESGATLAAYENYWAGKPTVANLEIKYFTDSNAMSLAVQSGEVDVAYGLPYATLSTFKENSTYRISEANSSRFVSFIYNFDKPIIANDSFRQALDLLVDKETYTTSLFQGSGTVAVGAFPQAFSFALENSVHEYNVEKAKTILDQAGIVDTNNDGIREFEGEEISLTLLSYNRLPEIPLAIQAFQQQLKEVGIAAEIQPVENIGDALKANEYDVSPYTMVAAPIGDPYAYFQSSLYSQGTANMGHYTNPAVDELIQQLVNETDLTKRNQLSKEIQTLVDQEYAFTFIAHFKVAVVMHSNIKGFESHPTDYYHVTHQLIKE